MGSCRGQVGHVYAVVWQRREKGVGRRAATRVCACELASRSSLVCRQVCRVPRGTLSCVPAVFSLPQGSQVALQGDTGVCVCVHTETVCFVYLKCKQGEIVKGTYSFTYTCVCVIDLVCEVSISDDRCAELPERSLGCFLADISSLHRISQRLQDDTGVCVLSEEGFLVSSAC